MDLIHYYALLLTVLVVLLYVRGKGAIDVLGSVVAAYNPYPLPESTFALAKRFWFLIDWSKLKND
tara:strand:- start:336 stop:530 length:195 start_codon:yes stop_codon:yes gene_type:complete